MKSFFIGAFAAIMACAIFFGALYGWHRLTRSEEYADETETSAQAANSAASSDAASETAAPSGNADYRQGYDDGYQAALNGTSTATRTTASSGTGSVDSSSAAATEDLTLYNETVMSEHRTPKNPAYGQTLSYAEAWSPYGDGTLASEQGTAADGTLNGDIYGVEMIPVPAPGIP